MRMNLITMTAPAGSLLIAVAALALVVATSAQAITPAPLHEPDGMITHVATHVARVCTMFRGSAA